MATIKSIEEKARRYDEALERAKNTIEVNQAIPDIVECVESLFPELAENKDEKIRKDIISYLALYKDAIGEEYESWIAWLEMQGELVNSLSKGLDNAHERIDELIQKNNLLIEQLEKQGEQNINRETKPRTYGDFIKRLTESEQEYIQGYVNKVIEKTKELQKQGELKFKVGDWIIFNGLTLYVNEVVQGYYRTISIDGIPISYDWDIDNVARPWTIQDAKDGDVLAAHECYVIFKEIDGLNIKCYCTYHYLGFNPIFYKDTLQNKDAFRPATKEQRDALMKAISDAGYTFDFEKKELKKIEQKTVEWSEEDEKQLSFCCAAIELSNYSSDEYRNYAISFLESLKDRVQPQPKQSTIKFDEPDIEEMVEDFWHNKDVIISSHTRGMIEEAYRQGLEDMWDKLKSK